MILLLDIDGVMVENSHRPLNILEDGFPEFIPEAVRALQRIMYEICPDVLIISSHKRVLEVGWFKSIFESRDIHIPKLDVLPDSEDNRKEEFERWCKTTIIDNFVLVDDDSSLHDLPEELKKKWIQTQPHIGLTMLQAEDIIQRVKQ